jgi:hypothetical protein
MLKAGMAIVYNTSNTGAERETEVFADPLETIWKNCIFGLCGVTNFYRRMFSTVVTSTATERQHWLDEVRSDIDRFLPMLFERKQAGPGADHLQFRGPGSPPM